MKKIVLILLALIIIAGGGLFFYMAQERFDAQKYSASMSDGLTLGSFVTFTLPDQFNNDVALSSSTRKLIIVFTKEHGHMVNAFLETKPKGYLKSHRALLMADISKMPTAIRNMFAIPSLKKSDYPTALIYTDDLAKVFKNPANADKIHFINLENNRIRSIQYLSSAQELDKLLK